MKFIVVVARNERPDILGFLSRHLIELDSGVFVGTLGNRTAQEIVDVIKQHGIGKIAITVTAGNEQRFTIEMFRDADKKVVDNYGICLVKRLKKNVDKSKENEAGQ